MGVGQVAIEHKAWRTLDRIARELNARSPRRIVDDLKQEVRRVGVRALDQLVGRLAGRSIDTEPRQLSAPTRARRKEDAPELALSFDFGVRLERPEAAPPDVAPPDVAPADVAPADVAPPPDARREAPIVPAPADAPRAAGAPAADVVIDAELTASAGPGTDALASMPPRSGIDRVVLVAGPSEWVFAYWEIEPARLSSAPATAEAQPRAELRLVDDQGVIISRTIVDPRQGRHHLRIPQIGRRYHAELCVIDPAEEGALISRSRSVIAAQRGDPVHTQTSETSPSA
ncbi:MAG: DUF4912 domain-containing protein [Deltaproteobacteria bacterium]|nr:DUF4912 domain-containing protein [Deltaproteobacteria bacterium]